MGKTADMTVVQKTIIDTLYKEGKPQTFIAKEAGCSQSAVSKHVYNRKLRGRQKCGGKRYTTNRDNRSLERLSLLNHRPHQRCLTWAKEKKKWTVAQWSKVLFSDESKFCISFGNQGPRVWRKGGEAHSPSCLKSSVKFPQSVMIWGAISSSGVATDPELEPTPVTNIEPEPALRKHIISAQSSTLESVSKASQLSGSAVVFSSHCFTFDLGPISFTEARHSYDFAVVCRPSNFSSV
ncbi:Transposable element Tc1 transposase [Labeo rohita]|uniref:Transposable element Tc1 transposase n=1 Tax=Labeo rohita TaxID=84645 RepID=A0ABQ8L5I0_LABRO|nr:Transposable element Tc1 transposase [Labeo rohita]